MDKANDLIKGLLLLWLLFVYRPDDFFTLMLLKLVPVCRFFDFVSLCDLSSTANICNTLFEQ